jgi:hypothetical protein
MSEASEQAADMRELASAVERVNQALDRAERETNQFRDAVRRAGSETESARSTFERFKSAFEFTHSLFGTANAVIGFGHALAEASAELAKQDRAVRYLGDAYAEIQRQTNGAVDAEKALELQGEIMSAGMQLTAHQMGLLTRAAREYALATGKDLSQAMNKLSNAVVNNSEDALTELNLAQARAATSTQTLANMTRMLEERYRNVPPAALSADEAFEQFNRSSQQLTNTLLSLAGQALTGLMDKLVQLGGSTESAASTFRTFAREVRDALSGADHAANEASNRALERARRITEQYQREVQAFRNSSLLQGSDIRLPDVYQLTIRQREQMVALFQEADRLSTEAFQRRAREILALAEQERAAAEGRRQATEMQRQVEQRLAELRREHATDELGMLRAAAERVGLRVYMQQRAISAQERLNHLQQQLGYMLANEAQNRQEIARTLQEATQLRQQIEQERQQREQQAQAARQRAREREELRLAERALNDEVLRGLMIGAQRATVERRRYETQREYIARQIEAQREANRVAQESLDMIVRRRMDEEREAEERLRRTQEELEARARERQAREKERNDIEQQLRRTFGLAQEEMRNTTEAMAEGAKVAYDGFTELGKSIVEATMAASQSGEDVGAAIAKQVDQWATAKAVQWGMQAIESFAGAGLAYFLRPDAVPGLLASGAMYAGLAAAAGVTAAVIPNAPQASSSSHAGDRAPTLAASSRSAGAEERAQPNIVFNISGLMANEQTQDVLARAIRDLSDRGMLPRA